MQGDGFPSSLRSVTWEFPVEMYDLEGSTDPEVADDMDLQPLLQLGGLEGLQFIFHALLPAHLPHGLLHKVVDVANEWGFESKSGGEMVWRTAASAAEQSAAGDVQLAAAAEASWGAVPLKSVRVIYSGLHNVFASMPTATVQALGALQLTELAIHGGNCAYAYLGLEVTPAQLGEVLQCLPLLQRLELEYFALLCDAELTSADASALPAQQQQQQQQGEVRMRPYHSAAGVTALVSAIGQLPKLQALQLNLLLLLGPEADVQEVRSALERWLPSVGLLNDVPQKVCAFRLPLYILRRRV
jgi:hypothetical protein